MSLEQPRTLLEQLVAAEQHTWPELTGQFLGHARDLHRETGEPMASLSWEHLQRIAAGKVTRPHPSTTRVLQRQFGRPIDELLGPPKPQRDTRQVHPREPSAAVFASFNSVFAPRTHADTADTGREFVLDASEARFFDGSTITGVRYPAVDDGRIVVRVPPGLVNDPILRRPGRSLIVGAAEGRAGPRLFGLDNRRARARLARTPDSVESVTDEVPLLIPSAYELDDLTLGVLWAVANFDDALLDDDGELAALASGLGSYLHDDRSTGGQDMGAGLTAVSRMWLGSDFCARHILRHAQALDEAPAFWTREQRGEEASTWLLFAHKYAYLRDTTATFHTTKASPSRAFCIPRAAVVGSSRAERILLLLAVALMESFGIAVEVCTEPEYAPTQGFALDQRQRAIVANWIGADELWQVDVTTHRPTVREFADAAGYAHAHSIIAASTPVARLRTLADYLNLDWAWLTCRCAQLGDYGAAGLAQPRSRLLSTHGLDQACRYLGDLGRHAGHGDLAQ